VRQRRRQSLLHPAPFALAVVEALPQIANRRRRLLDQPVALGK
jgi:hypothetical protein